MVSIDFNAQELRVLAHVSQDKTLLNIYRNGLDAHAMTALDIWNLENPDKKVDYEYFQYCRSLQELFLDADGEIDQKRLYDSSFIQQLYAEEKIKSKEVSELQEQVVLGKQFEKVRKQAKTINFGIIA